MSKRVWYSHDPDGKTTLHGSVEDAEISACADMAHHADCAADDGWHKDIAALSWGEMVRHGEARLVASAGPTKDLPDGTEEWVMVKVGAPGPPFWCENCERRLSAGETFLDILGTGLSHIVAKRNGEDGPCGPVVDVSATERMADPTPANRSPHRCPVCDGAGTVSRPPHVAGDQWMWESSDVRVFECPACAGRGVLWE